MSRGLRILSIISIVIATIILFVSIQYAFQNQYNQDGWATLFMRLIAILGGIVTILLTIPFIVHLSKHSKDVIKGYIYSHLFLVISVVLALIAGFIL